MALLALVAALVAAAPAPPARAPSAPAPPTAAPASAATAKPKLAVLDFAARNATKELAGAAAGIAANELDRMATFQIITSDAIRNMLAFEKQRQMLGCADSGCMAEIGGALGVDWLVSGSVTRLAAAGGVPETYSLELTLTNVRKASREGSAIESAKTEAELVQKTGKAAQRLVAKILAGRTGRLLVSVVEVGAVVKVDDQAKGTTPLHAPITLPAGPHQLVVEKKGFVAYQKDVQIDAGKVADERVTLVPSPDFVKEYEARQRKMRYGAWISTGVAAVGVATAVALQVSANSKYGNDSTPGTFLYARSKLEAGNESYRSQAESLKSQIETRQTWSYVAGGLGVAGAVAATYFWIAGEDPRRYQAFSEQTASLGVTPTPGGLVASAAVRF